MTIEEFCGKYNIRNYTVVDGLINVNGKVNLWQIGENKIPYKFGTVDGYFEISFSMLSTLEGLPNIIKGNLFMVNSSLKKLDYLPNKVTGLVDLSFNQLSDLYSLKGLDCGKINVDSNPVGYLYKFGIMEEVDAFNTLRVVIDNELNLKRLKYFYSLMDRNFDLDIDKLSKFYTIKE